HRDTATARKAPEGSSSELPSKHHSGPDHVSCTAATAARSHREAHSHRGTERPTSPIRCTRDSQQRLPWSRDSAPYRA
ncbi:Hypothetical predicted protein, partial [Pelobates cultripes]